MVQVIDGVAVESIANRFNQEAAGYELQHGTPWPGMLIDREHFKHQTDKETTAYGWLMRLENRGGKLFGEIRWSNTGRAAVDGGDYRFFSTEYDADDLQVLNRGSKPARVRPLRLAGLTLTNDPGNKGGKPITNRESSASEPTGDDTRTAADEALVIANRIKRETGCSFDLAWNQVQLSQPALFNRMAAQPAPRVPQTAIAVLTNREQHAIRFAADRLQTIATNRARAARIPFDIAWQQVCRDFPDVNAKAHGRVFNRAQIEGVSESDWKAANSRADKVYSMLEDEATSGVDRGTFVTDAQLRGVFKRAIDRAMRDENMTRREAFDQIKEAEPIFWARAMLDFELL